MDLSEKSAPKGQRPKRNPSQLSQQGEGSAEPETAGLQRCRRRRQRPERSPSPRSSPQRTISSEQPYPSLPPRPSPPPRTSSSARPSPPRPSPPRNSYSARPHPAQHSDRTSSPLRYARLGASSSSPPGSSSHRDHTESEGAPIVDLHLDNAESLCTALQGVKQYLLAVLKEDSIELPEGKLVTHDKGCIVLRITASASNTEQPVYASYRTKDLYLDSIVSKSKCYRFNDHDKDLVLPPELPFDTVVTFDFSSNYQSLNCFPRKSGQIRIGEAESQKHYGVLLDLDNKLSKDFDAVQRALVWLVTIFSEALRFPGLEDGLFRTLASRRTQYIPLKLTVLFNKCGAFSKILHAGRGNFKAGSVKDDGIKDQDIVEQWSSYDTISSILGVVNRLNWRKMLKTEGKRKAKLEKELESEMKRKKKP